jgi:hypothetical protein
LLSRISPAAVSSGQGTQFGKLLKKPLMRVLFSQNTQAS